MITDALYDGYGAGIPDAETLGSYATDEHRAGSGAVQARVTGNDVFFRPEDGCFRRIDGDMTSRQSLGHVVVGITFERYIASGDEESTETLTGRACHADVDASGRKTRIAMLLGDVVAEHAPHGAVHIDDLDLEIDAEWIEIQS